MREVKRTEWLALLAAISLALAATSCGSGGMPLTRPADLRVELLDGGGMSPESETIFLSADSSYYENWYDQARNHTALPVSAAELDTLWDLMRRNGALSVTSREEGMVYDRGGTTISIHFANVAHSITNAGSSFVSPRHVSQYNTIVDGIWALARKHINRMKVEVPITIVHHADSIPMDYFNLSVDGQPVYNWEATRDEPFSEVQAAAKCLPGNHQLNAWAKVKGQQLSVNEPRTLRAGAPVVIEVWGDSLGVR